MVNAVSISSDGEYIIAGSKDNKAYLFDKDSSTPVWSYTACDDFLSVAISSDDIFSKTCLRFRKSFCRHD